MNLTAADIAEILRLVEGSTFDELSLEFEGLKLNFKRGADGAIARPAAPASPTAMLAPVEPPPVAAAAADPNLLDVRSPMLGTFYRAPKPGAPPYVAVGAAVEAETIVCIIEVMKLMNTVRAEVRGTVAEILVADGALVEYGEILLRVRKPD
ncbi:MAG TPA: acetyl-CoA carboxylase biotin carboxyl carrier protein [Steroidobacteraceae bacterium]|jgi:acetyl-CoA carboxylase biotin carboxyl carrier protein